MLLELRHSQGKRTLIYRDTVKASDIQRTHLNDSVDREYVDSAFAVADTAVSLSHKEWLDSELVEIPELERFGTKVHFTYPPAIMVETQVQSVPFDTSVLGHMSPITRENLPFFDQSPMPLPLRPSSPFEGYIEAGAGNIYLPLAGAWLSQTLSPRSYIAGRAQFLSRSSTPVKSLLTTQVDFHAQLGADPAQELYESSDLGLGLSFDSKATQIRSALDSDWVTRTQSLFGAHVGFIGDATDKFHYELLARDNEFRDQYSKGLSESEQLVSARVNYDPYISHFRFIVEGEHHVASLRMDTTGSGALGSLNPVRSDLVKALFGRRKGEALEWYGGVAFISGTDALGIQHSLLSPIGRIRMPLNPRWEIGGYYEPNADISTMRSLATVNPFFSPYAAAPFEVDSVARHLDVRSVAIDRVRFGAFMNYALSNDDQLRTEVRFTTRSGEPVFLDHTLDSNVHVFSVEPLDTRRLKIIFGGNFLLFDRDVLSTGVEYSSATESSQDEAIPFEPSLKVDVAYHFNSVSSWFQPVLEFRAVTRTDRTITLLNAQARIAASAKISIFVRADNLTGSASDFWPGYEETPRSLWATIRFAL